MRLRFAIFLCLLPFLGLTQIFPSGGYGHAKISFDSLLQGDCSTSISFLSEWKASAGTLDSLSNPCVDGVGVATWEDQASTRDFSQSTSGNRPMYVADHHGSPSLYFDGADFMELASDVSLNSTSMVIFVGTATDNQVNAQLATKASSYIPTYFFQNNSCGYRNASTPLDDVTGLADGYHQKPEGLAVYIFRRGSGTELKAWKDGVFRSNTGDDPTGGISIGRVGGRVDPVAYFTGYIKHIIFINNAVCLTQMDRLCVTLAEMYNIPLAVKAPPIEVDRDYSHIDITQFNPKYYWDAYLGVSVSGSDVTSWADQSGNGHTLSQSNSSKRPNKVTNAWPNSSGTAILFNGTVDLMYTSSHSWTANAMSVYFVVQWSDSTVTDGSVIGRWDNSGGDFRQFWVKENGINLSTDGTSGTLTNPGSGISHGRWEYKPFLYSRRFDSGATDPNGYGRINNTGYQRGGSAGDMFDNTNNTAVGEKSLNTTGSPFPGYIYAIVVFDEFVSDQVDFLVRQYLIDRFQLD